MSDPDDAPLLDADAVAQLERLSLVELDAVLSGVVGQHAGPTGASGLEFADYRRYRPGDELRRIDWNVYARLREPFIKTAPTDMRIGLSLLVDGSRSLDSGRPTKMRHAQRLAATLGAIALLRWDTVQISMLADGTARAAAALAAPQLLGALVEELGRMPRGERTDLASSVRAYRRSEPGVNAAIMLTDALVEPKNASEALRELSASAGATAIVHLVDPDDEAMPPLGPVELRDRETGERMTVDVTESVRSRHAATFAEHGRALEAASRAHGVRYLRAPTGVDPVDLLFEAARTAEIVRA